MPQQFTVTIPTSPYIKALVAHLYGHPVRINNKNTVGCFLIGVLSKKTFDAKLITEHKDLRFKFFIEEITCIAPWSQMDNYGWHLTENHIIQINRFFENIFDTHLYFYVQNRIKNNIRYAGYNQAYESFIIDYKMPENVTVELLKQIEYRFRKRLKKSIPELILPEAIHQNALFA